MQEKRVSQSKLHKNERRGDMQIIRTRVSKKEIYVWMACLVFITAMLMLFAVLSFFVTY